MFGKLLILFIAVPFIEMMLLIKLGQMFGFWDTVIFIVLMGFLGAAIARYEGVKTWIEIQRELSLGRMPGEQMIDAFLIFVAGILLITPGVLTDFIGLLFLIPPARKTVKQWLRKKIDEMLKRSSSPPNNFNFFNYS